MQHKNPEDQLILATAGEIAMDVAEESIIREANRSGKMWMPRLDPEFMAMIRVEYQASGATVETVDAVVGDIHGEGQVTGSTPGLVWITSFQAIVALEAIAVSDGAITEGEHPLLEHFSVLQRQYG